jgi:ElaB/YqjD/DUF883 family membrane-anchored ribosome-binding protein
MSEALVHVVPVPVPRSRLHESLARLDVAARARLVEAGDDTELVVARVITRLEARATASLREGLRANAWLAIGITIGVGVLLGSRSR